MQTAYLTDRVSVERTAIGDFPVLLRPESSARFVAAAVDFGEEHSQILFVAFLLSTIVAAKNCDVARGKPHLRIVRPQSSVVAEVDHLLLGLHDIPSVHRLAEALRTSLTGDKVTLCVRWSRAAAHEAGSCDNGKGKGGEVDHIVWVVEGERASSVLVGKR
jgi:hypothetical protein